MEEADVIVIGAGVVGLAISARLAERGKDVICIEKHPTFGQETSSRNSEVIHSGIYYKTDSLKAKLCVEGRQLIYEFCDKYAVPYTRLGKLIVAVDVDEIKTLRDLIQQGHINGVADLTLINYDDIRIIQPNIKAIAAIDSPSTGIIDTHRFMKTLELQGKDNSAIFAYGCEVVGIERGGRAYEVIIKDADGELMRITAEKVINSGGLYADSIAAMIGIDAWDSGYKIHYSKGEYFRVSPSKATLVDKLIYPTPDKESLGIHTVSDMQGELKLGPNAFYVDKINHDVDPSHAIDFYESVKEFLPFLEPDDLTPDMSGIRPKTQKKEEGFKDFIINDEADKNLPGFINLIGIESPGLTASLAIAKYIENMV